MPPEEETSMRAAFDAAIDAIENDDEGAVTTETKAEAEQTPPITSEDLFSDDGEKAPETEAKAKVEAEADKASGEEPDVKPDADAKPDVTASDADTGDESAAATVDKAPESWNPEAREGWADLSAPMKAQIAKRETEINKSLNEGAQNRKTGAAFQGIADRYAQVFAAEGAPDALTGIEELIKTVSTLRMGSAQQKAEKLAGFIKHYGVDIGQLDDILSGQVSGKPAVADPMQRMIDERMAPVNSLLEQMNNDKKAAQYKTNQDAITEVQTFKGANEFYADVQNDMADMVELAEKRGVVMPLQEAYDKACAMNPEISTVIAKRAADAKLINGGRTLDAKRDASSSIIGKQSGQAVVDEEGMTMRQMITAGFDSQVG